MLPRYRAVVLVHGGPWLRGSNLGWDAEAQFFASRGLPMPQLVIENGSGLSRIERVSARDLGQMLLTAYRSPVMPEFMV